MRIQVKQSVTGMLIGMAAFVVVASARPAGAQTPDPVVGTWKLDPAKSSYKPGPAPKSATVVVESVGKAKGLKVAVDAVNADGSPLKWGFTTERDGKEVPVTGNPMYDTATSTQASPTTGTTVYKKDGKVVVTSKLAVSSDGKTMTLTGTGTDAKGQAIHNVAVYTKQ
jgi:hypothetical protein